MLFPLPGKLFFFQFSPLFALFLPVFAQMPLSQWGFLIICIKVQSLPTSQPHSLSLSPAYHHLMYYMVHTINFNYYPSPRLLGCRFMNFLFVFFVCLINYIFLDLKIVSYSKHSMCSTICWMNKTLMSILNTHKKLWAYHRKEKCRRSRSESSTRPGAQVRSVCAFVCACRSPTCVDGPNGNSCALSETPNMHSGLKIKWQNTHCWLKLTASPISL